MLIALSVTVWLCWGCSSLAPVTDHFVLVSQAGSSTVAVIDPLRGEVVKRITVGMLPHRLVKAASGEVYAVLVGSQAIAEIDPLRLELKRTLLTASVPMTRADGSPIQGHINQNAAAYTTCFACHNDSSTGVKPLYVGARPVGLTLSADETQVIVAHLRETRLSVLDRGSGRVERSWSLAPSGAASEASDVVRVGARYAVSLRAKQPATTPGALRWLDSAFAPLSDTALGSDPSALLALEDQRSVLVSNFDSNTVTQVREDGSSAALEVAPGPLGALRLPDGRVLVLNYYSNSVSLVNLEQRTERTVALTLGGKTFVNPTHAALAPDGKTAYIVASGTDAYLLSVDLSTLNVTRAVPVDGLSFDVVVVPAPDSVTDTRTEPGMK
jgi:DNA-binding beta-propeller fold protein YncE